MFDEDEDPLLCLRGEVLSAHLDENGRLVLFYPKGKAITLLSFPDGGIALLPRDLPEC